VEAEHSARLWPLQRDIELVFFAGLLRNTDDAALQTSATIDSERTYAVGLILLVLLLVLIFAGAGFALHVLWIIAVVLLLVWLLGFLVSGAEHSWYRVQKK
jgi:hypothetical protein